MEKNNGPADEAALEAAQGADEIQVQIRALTDASTQRHRLVRGTPEYEAALETEERLASHVWSLATGPEPPGESPTEAQERADPEP